MGKQIFSELNKSFLDLVNGIYKFSGVSSDPLEEFGENVGEGSLGIIEFIRREEG